MKAPYFKLEQGEGAEVYSKIMLEDKTPLHYIRRRVRRYTNRLWVLSDSYIRELFENADGKVFDFDELYVLFDKKGLPICVSVSDCETRVLYAGCYRRIAANRVKITDNPRALYMAYLEMFPQSALDMSAFVPQRKQYFLSPENCLYDNVWTAATEVGNKINFSVNAAKSGVQIWKLYKILFELNKNGSIERVYSAVGKTYSKYVTRAEVISSGEDVITEFEKISYSNSKLKELLKDIL